MPLDLLSADDFRMAAKDGGSPEGMVFRFAPAEPETIGDIDARVKRFVFSDSSIDLAGDVIKQDGWDLKNFERNPVALFAHTSWEPPIGRASGVGVKNGKLIGDIEFASAEVYPFADTIYRLVDGGFLKAVSVGFKPTEWKFASDKNRPYGIDFIKQLLCEISVCAIPCNPNALEEARSVGIDTRALVDWAEKVLDSGDTMFLPRKELEKLRHQAGGIERRFYISTDNALPDKVIERIRDAVKTWQRDASEVLILPPGVSLHTVGEDVPVVVAPAEAVEAEIDTEAEKTVEDIITRLKVEIDAEGLKEIEALIDKAGRRVSAATKAKLQEALDHHAAATKCVMEAMGSNDEPDENDDPDAPTVQPPGSVVLEAVVDESLTPEQRRLKEVQALRADLPTND